MTRSRAAIVVLLAWCSYSLAALAIEFPMIPFEVSSRILDSNTKYPIAGVQLIVFLNNARYADNHGSVPKPQDYPNLPRTDADGYFKARTRLYRSGPKIEINRVEIIAFREGYRTERFVFERPKYRVSNQQNSGTIEVPEFFLLRNPP